MKSKYDYNLAEKMWNEHMEGKKLIDLEKKYHINCKLISAYLTRYLKDRKQVAAN